MADDAPRTERRTAHSLGWMACALLIIDAGAMAGLHVATSATANAEAAEGGEEAPAKEATAKPDQGWYVCQIEHGGRTVSPVSVAVTYLDTGPDRDVTAGEVGSWFGDLDRSSIDVWKLETVQGERRIAFELSRARWPRWDRVTVHLAGKDVCSAVRGELLAHGVGRPRPPTAPGLSADLMRSRHDFELIYARRPGLYRRIEWAGTLDGLLDPVEFAMLHRWLQTGG